MDDYEDMDLSALLNVRKRLISDHCENQDDLVSHRYGESMDEDEYDGETVEMEVLSREQVTEIENVEKLILKLYKSDKHKGLTLNDIQHLEEIIELQDNK